MSALVQWGMDIFSLDSLVNGHSLVAVTYTVLKVIYCVMGGAVSDKTCA